MKRDRRPSRKTGPSIRYAQAVCHRVNLESGAIGNPLQSEKAEGYVTAREKYETVRTMVGELEKLFKEGNLSLDKEVRTQYRTLKESMAELEKVLTPKDQPAKTVKEQREVLGEGAKIEEAVETSEERKFSGRERSGQRNAGGRVDQESFPDFCQYIGWENYPPLAPVCL